MKGMLLPMEFKKIIFDSNLNYDTTLALINNYAVQKRFSLKKYYKPK